MPAYEWNDFLIRFDLQGFLETEGFGHHVCELLVALARQDGHITLEEYRVLLSVVGQASQLTDHPQLFHAVICHYLVQNVTLDAVLRKLEKSAPDASAEARDTAMRMIEPLLAQQGSSADELRSRIRNALRLDGAFKAAIGSLRELISGKAETPSGRAKLRRLAEAYGDNALLGILATAEGSDAPEDLPAQVEQLKRTILDQLADFEVLARDNRLTVLSERAAELSAALLDSTAKRLAIVQRRLELQDELFSEDVEAFFESAMDAFELAMHDSKGALEGSEAAWQQFARGEGRALFKHYQTLRRRYDAVNRLWDQEIQAFTDEIGHTRQTLERHHSSDFIGLIPPRSWVHRGLDKLDGATDLAIGAAGVGAAGLGVTALVGGSAAWSGVAFLLTNPIGQGVAGVIALAAVYKYFSSPSTRHLKQIKNMRQKVEAGFKSILNNPIETHAAQLDEVMKKFLNSAQKTLLPVAIDLEASRYLGTHQPRAIAAIAHDIRADLATLAV